MYSVLCSGKGVVKGGGHFFSKSLTTDCLTDHSGRLSHISTVARAADVHVLTSHHTTLHLNHRTENTAKQNGDPVMPAS